MKKEEDTPSVVQSILGFAGNLVNGVSGNVVSSVKEAVEETEEKLMKKITATAIFLTGVVFISIAAVNLINDYLALNTGWAFVIVGLVLFIWSLSLKSKIEVK